MVIRRKCDRIWDKFGERDSFINFKVVPYSWIRQMWDYIFYVGINLHLSSEVYLNVSFFCFSLTGLRICTLTPSWLPFHLVLSHRLTDHYQTVEYPMEVDARTTAFPRGNGAWVLFVVWHDNLRMPWHLEVLHLTPSRKEWKLLRQIFALCKTLAGN